MASDMKTNNFVRVYDKEGYRLRAVCICVKDETEEEVLLVSSTSQPNHWIVPGGGLDPGETSQVAAVRETIEEAGVQGKIDRFLGTYQNDERKHRTDVYVLLVTEELPVWDDSKIGRKRKWFNFEDAIQQLTNDKPAHLPYFENLKPNKKGSGLTGNCNVTN